MLLTIYKIRKSPYSFTFVFALQTSQNIDIVRWGPAEPYYENSLRGHTRTVTDIDWHSKSPNLLVSCSIDTFSHIWDLRDPRKPALSLNAVCMCNYDLVSFYLYATYVFPFTFSWRHTSWL